MAWGNDKVNGVTCSEVGKSDVYLEMKARQKITFLMEEYPSQEWVAYMVGKETEKSNFFVEDIVVPPHKDVSSGGAEVEPMTVPKDCVGIIHSHHTMGAFHSHTDQTYADRNHPVSITVAKRNGNLEYDAVSAKRTPCGKISTVKADVFYVAPPPSFDKEEWLEEAKANIDKGKKAIVVRTGYPGYPYYRTGYGCYGGQEETVPMTKKEKKRLKKRLQEEGESKHLIQGDIPGFHNLYGETLSQEELDEMGLGGMCGDYWG